MRLLLLGITAIFCTSAATPEEHALQISLDIQARHTPFGTILNPYYASPVSSEVLTYTRCGDSAIWTGHWLAAEAFRYKVTRSPESLDAAKRALRAIQLLVEVTGPNNLLARCALRSDSPFSAGPRSEEKSHGEYLGKFENTDYYWIGNTSRDQYLGVFFGLSAAYESIGDPAFRATVKDLVTRLLDRLIAKNWAIVMPDGDISTVFWLRPDQELAIRQVGRQVNPGRFAKGYEDKRRDAGGLNIIMAFEASDENGSYFKFNLNAISWYTLIHLEEPDSPKRSEYLSAYHVFRNAVASHGNAFFNVVDRALTGPEARRDAETLDLMSQWLLRPKRDPFIDLRGKYRACGENRACDPIPVVERVSTDFLWQRSPFQLYGGGTGQIESPGVDYILPYWMGRAFGLDFNLLAVSAASGRPGLAPDSIATIYGSGFTEGSQIRVTDSAGVERAGQVFFLSARQINFLIPVGTARGAAKISVWPAGSSTAAHATTVSIQAVAPAVFSAAATGKGVAAALAVQPNASGALVSVPVFRCTGPLLCVAQRLEPFDGRPVYVSLYGTGLRGFRSGVRASFGGENIPVEYAGPQNQFPGLDQVNIRIQNSIRVRGEQDLVLTVDGIEANPVRLLVP